ncbi:MAG: PilZ domain-containing protein [Magnetococcales bacterium]|nr:PilZ domain-containing protein [Magnetococcales bacterium]MBF0149526.1 PilZ domain-containing protein [Magnetococcales bacterium]MBF0174399.1 PilZ domain-containing protein [Magnetococcales bacterium]MBF0348055.1 PilZ domain-containing protein [Magnetococcales bacterium]MBF0630812.1 PilZ domain-containing protein [Magnetococcales bacterium]
MAAVTQKSVDNQQRAFARVDDFLPLSWRRVSAEEFADVIANFNRTQSFPIPPDDIQTVLANLEVTDKIQQLERSDPVLSRILSRLDMKLNMLLKVFYPGTEARPMVPTWVNMSGGGLAFKEAGLDVQVGDVLEIRLALSLDSLASIQCFARVVKTFPPDEDGLIKAACQFEPILDGDREKLIQHIFKRQSALLRSKRS